MSCPFPPLLGCSPEECFPSFFTSDAPSDSPSFHLSGCPKGRGQGSVSKCSAFSLGGPPRLWKQATSVCWAVMCFHWVGHELASDYEVTVRTVASSFKSVRLSGCAVLLCLSHSCFPSYTFTEVCIFSDKHILTLPQSHLVLACASGHVWLAIQTTDVYKYPGQSTAALSRVLYQCM